MANSTVRSDPPRRVVFAPFVSPHAAAPVEEKEAGPTLEQVRQEAARTAYAEGLARGVEDGIRLLRDQASRLSGLIDRAAHDAEAAVLALEPDLVDLALTVAGRLVEGQLIEDRDLVVDVVRAALTAAGAVRLVRVRINPEDQLLVQPVWEQVGPGTPAVDLVADPHVERGGCVVDTASGFVDAQPSVRLEEIRRQIVSRLGVVG